MDSLRWDASVHAMKIINDSVLIADDDERIRAILLRALARRDFQCMAVSTAKALTETCSRQAPRAVVSDISLGDGDGIEICLELRRRYPNLPIVMMTGDPQQFDRAKASGFDKVLLKPFPLDEFRRALDEALAGKPQDH